MKFYIDAAQESKHRNLVVHYEKGGYQGAPEFVTSIPDDWSEENVIDFLLWPMKDQDAPYPPWEVPARAYGSRMLFRWWVGEKPQP